MEKHFERVCVLTQNVDGFHHQAGSQNLIEIHGDIHQVLCTRCGYFNDSPNYAGMSIPPLCHRCNSVLRPNVVLFGEMLPDEQVTHYEEEMRKGIDMVFSVGTSSQFPYIISPVIKAHRQQKPVVEINPGETDVSYCASVTLRMGAAQAMEAIWKSFSDH